MVIYFSITIFERNAECFQMEGNSSIFCSGKQTQKDKCSAADTKSTILWNLLASDDKLIAKASLQLLDMTVKLQKHPFTFY